ncbi:MAG: hypothetical protein Q9201_005990 [Fulgogasparrea decipioides]
MSTDQSPRDILVTAIATNSIPEIQHGLDLFAQSRCGLSDNNLEWALNLAVKSSKPDVVSYLVDVAGARVEMVRAQTVGTASGGEEGEREERDGEEGGMEKVIQVLEVLVQRGWDVNNASKSTQPLIYHLIHSTTLVAWALSHGAHTTYLSLPPLTEEIASHGTLPTLQLTLQHNAPLGRRTLHRAVQSAAYASPTNKEERMEMVRYLVEEAGLDVNGMDVKEEEQKPNHWGSPMAYAVGAKDGKGDGGAEVVRFLMKKGADPGIRDCWGLFDVKGLAEKMANERVLAVLREWDGKREAGEEARD